LLKVVHTFDHQLPVLSKQRAMSEWQIYFNLATIKSCLMSSHLPVYSQESAAAVKAYTTLPVASVDTDY